MTDEELEEKAKAEQFVKELRVPRFEYDENNFFTEWDDILRDKIVIVSDSKEQVKRWIEKDTLYNLDFVCPSDDKDSPFCDYGDDELWTYAYYDPKIDYFWKLKHGYIDC